jgi:hypothetical protein
MKGFSTVNQLRKTSVSTPWLNACIAASLLSWVGCGGEPAHSTDTAQDPSSVAAQRADEAAFDAVFAEWKAARISADDPQLQHKPPAVRLMIDGMLQPPETIARFNGRPVIYLVNAEAQEGRFAYVFSSPEQLREHLKATHALPRLTSGPSAAAGTVPATFYADANLTGWTLQFLPGVSDSDLRDNSVNWFWNWNDQISSVTAAPTGSYTILYQSVGFGGSTVVVAAGTMEYNLAWLNFDNLTSSIKVLQ